MREAVRSRTGCGSLSEGAWGGPGLAQPMVVKVAARAAQPRSREEARRSLRQNKSMELSLAFRRTEPGILVR